MATLVLVSVLVFENWSRPQPWNLHSLSVTQQVKLQWFEQSRQLAQVEYGEDRDVKKTRHWESSDISIKLEIRVKSYTKLRI